MPIEPPPALAGPSGIKDRQNDPAYLKLLYAKKHRHDVAVRWANANVIGTVGFAVAVPFITMIWPRSAAWLSAAAAGWLVLGKGLFRRFEQNNTTQGVRYQEQFEVGLFRLPWNLALVGEPPKPDAIADDARRASHKRSQDDWFYDDGKTPRPVDILLSQLESALWARRNHNDYARRLTAFAAAVSVIGVVIAVAGQLTLTAYLLRLLFPSLPALQDALLLADEHRRHATAKEQVESQILDLLSRCEAGQSVTEADCRGVQDAVHQVRMTGPSVPTWFYRRHRGPDQAAVHATIDDWRDRTNRTRPTTNSESPPPHQA